MMWRGGGFDCWSSMDRAFAATYTIGGLSEMVEAREPRAAPSETLGSPGRAVFTSLGGVNRAIAAISSESPRAVAAISNESPVVEREILISDTFFPGNGHYYAVVRHEGITWKEAKRRPRASSSKG